MTESCLYELPITKQIVDHHLIRFFNLSELLYWDDVDHYYDLKHLSLDQVCDIRRKTKRKTRIVDIVGRVMELKDIEVLKSLNVQSWEWAYFKLKEEGVNGNWICPPTSIEILNWLWDHSHKHLINHTAIDCLVNLQWFKDKNVWMGGSAWSYGIRHGNRELLDYASKRDLLQMCDIRSPIHDAMSRGYYWVVDIVMEYILIHKMYHAREHLGKYLLECKIPDTILKNMITKHEFVIEESEILYEDLSVELLIWLQESRRTHFNWNDQIRYWINHCEYGKITTLLTKCKLEINWSFLTNYNTPFHLFTGIYDHSSSFRDYIKTIDMNSEIQYYVTWEWLIEHDVKPKDHIIKSKIPIYEYVKSYQQLQELVDENDKDDSLWKWLLKHVDRCFCMDRYEVMKWIMDVMDLYETSHVKHSFSTWFRSKMISCGFATTCPSSQLFRFYGDHDTDKYLFTRDELTRLMRNDYVASTGLCVDDWKYMKDYIQIGLMIDILYEGDQTYKSVSFFNDAFDLVWYMNNRKLYGTIDDAWNGKLNGISRNNKRFIVRMNQLKKQSIMTSRINHFKKQIMMTSKKKRQKV